MRNVATSIINRFNIEIGLPDSFAAGENQNPNSAMIRPLRQFIEKHKSIGRFVYVFVQEKGTEQGHLLGTFLLTIGARLLFYPGLNVLRHQWSTKENRKLVGLDIDHFTLEPDWTWHLTSREAKKKKDNYSTKEISNGVRYWFGLSVRNLACLEYAPRKTVINFSSDNRLSAEKLSEFIGSRAGGKWPRIEIPRDDDKNSFVHVDFLIDSRFLSNLRSRGPLMYGEPPTAPPALIKEIRPQNNQFLTTQADIKIPTYGPKIVINISRHPGQLTDLAIITDISSRND